MATAVRERPIIMRAAEVRAILDGRKTQTRRIIKPRPVDVVGDGPAELVGEAHQWMRCDLASETLGRLPFWTRLHRPFGSPGERLWVKEKHSLYKVLSTPAKLHDATYCCFPDGSQKFKTGGYHHWNKPVSGNWPKGHRWRPSIHMPRWASRLTLEIVSVRPERLNEISEADAKAEGVEPTPGTYVTEFALHGYVDSFARLWDSLHGDGAFDLNPWIWRIEFRRVGG